MECALLYNSNVAANKCTPLFAYVAHYIWFALIMTSLNGPPSLSLSSIYSFSEIRKKQREQIWFGDCNLYRSRGFLSISVCLWMCFFVSFISLMHQWPSSMDICEWAQLRCIDMIPSLTRENSNYGKKPQHVIFNFLPSLNCKLFGHFSTGLVFFFHISFAMTDTYTYDKRWQRIKKSIKIEKSIEIVFNDWHSFLRIIPTTCCWFGLQFFHFGDGFSWYENCMNNVWMCMC